MTETQQRFLRAIAERVPSEQVVEVHLFPPIRQGGVETGVAVVAEDPRKRAPESVPVTVEANGTAEVVSAQQAQHGDDEPQPAAAAVEVAEIDVAEQEVAELDVVEPDVSDVEPADTERDDESNGAGIDVLLTDLGRLGIRFKDLETRESSLEEIFVDLVRHGQ